MRRKLLFVMLAALILNTFGVSASAAGKLEINVAFQKEYLDTGSNIYCVNAENKGDTAETFRITAALYKDGKLSEMSVGSSHTLAAGKDIYYTESFEADSESMGSELKLFVWDTESGMKPITQVYMPQGVRFEYAVAEKSAVSAGVYDSEDRLVRTLWSGRQTEAGVYTGVWDGKDDNGYRMTDGKYTVKIMTNNVSYTLETVVGNNSEWRSAGTVFRGMSFLGDMVCAGDKIYYTQPYTEGHKTGAFFYRNDIHKACNNERFGLSNQTSRRVASDGNMIYYGNTEPGGKKSFVYAYTADTYKEVEFEYGEATTNIWNQLRYKSVINLLEHDSCANIGGLDVQKNGNLLFVSYIYTGKVYVLNKTTGQKLYEMNISMPQAVCCNDNGVWVGYKKDNGKMAAVYYTAASNGMLTKQAELSEEFDDIRDIAVSPDNQTLVIADAGNSNRIKAFDVNSRARIWTYGSGESYSDDPTVYDDKLMLSVKNPMTNYTFVMYEDNNTLWFGDVGNCRAFKLDLSGGKRTLADMLMFQDGSHNAAVDLNNPTRVFTNLREFEIDYAESDPDKSWKLKRNWMKQAEDLHYYDQGLFANLNTLSNGRTYCKIYEANMADNEYTNYLYEMTENSLRNTGIELSDYELQRDGSLGRYYVYDGKMIWAKKELNGFDENNNPTWKDEEIVASAVRDNYSPTQGSRNTMLPITEGGIVVSLANNKNKTPYQDKAIMHLGGININKNPNEWAWKTSPQGAINYRGAFPEDGVFEAGNGVSGCASDVKTLGRNVIYQYHGEFYRSGQTNKFYHYYENGLLVGVFGGANAQPHKYGENPEQYVAGNAFDFYFVQPEGVSDYFYIFQNDESHKDGIWRTKVTGLDSINTQSREVELRSNLHNGLVWEYFSEKGYDIVKRTAGGITSVFNNQDIAADTEQDFVIRYTGYFKMPPKAKQLLCNTSGMMKITLDNSVIYEKTGRNLIDLPKLETGKLYPIVIECTKNGDSFGNPKILIKYSGSSRYFEMDSLFYHDNGKYANPSVKKYNLMEGLPFDSLLSEDTCGWVVPKNPVSQFTNLKTNVLVDAFSEPRDLAFSTYTHWNDSATDTYAETSRLLPSAEKGIKNWSLDSNVAIEGWMNGGVLGDETKSTGRHFDVLDENGKIISRFFWGRGDKAGDGYYAYANGVKLYQGEQQGNFEGVSTYIFHEFSTPSSLVISGNEQGITFEYYGKSVTLPVYENGADWSRPAKVRVSQFHNKQLNANVANFTFYIESMDYTLNY